MLLHGEFLIKFPDFFTKLLFSATSQNAIVMSMFGEKSEFWTALVTNHVTVDTKATRKCQINALMLQHDVVMDPVNVNIFNEAESDQQSTLVKTVKSIEIKSQRNRDILWRDVFIQISYA